MICVNEIPLSVLLLCKQNPWHKLIYPTIWDRNVSNLVKAITSKPGLNSLLELLLTGNSIGKNCCIALVALLKHTGSRIHHLEVQYNKLDNECLAILINGLVDINFNKILTLRSQHSEIIPSDKNARPDWFAFFMAALLDHTSSLQSLLLGDNKICNLGVISLGNHWLSTTE